MIKLKINIEIIFNSQVIRENKSICNLVILLLLLVTGLINNSQAQTSFAKTIFNTKNGLSYNFVQHITQDSTGFLWISTWDGLSRFDGNEFRNYYHKPNDPKTFPFFIVAKTFVDKQNNVWVICPYRPLTIYNRTKDSFDRFKPDGENEFATGDVISGDGNDLWMINGLESTIYRYNTLTKEMASFSMVLLNGEHPSISDFLPKLNCDNKGGIWVVCIQDGLNEIYKTNFIDSGKVQLEKLDPLPLHFFEPFAENRRHSVYDIYVDKNGTTWFFTTFGLFYNSPGQNQLIENKHEINTSNFSGKPYFYWSCKETGINVLETTTGELFNIKTDPEKHISTVFIDSQGNIWNGDYLETYEEIGLTRYVKIPNLFKHYLTEKNEFGNRHLVFPILKDKHDDIWVGTRGIDYLFKIKPDGTVVETNFSKQIKGIENLQVKTMVEDSLGIWLGTSQNLLVRYNLETTNFTPIYFDEKEPIRIHNILKENNDIIINGRDITYSFNSKSSLLSARYKSNNYPKFSMISDGNSGFWLGSIESTIFHLNAQFKEVGKYRIGDGSTNVEHMYLGDNNDVWIALMGGGLGHLYLKNDSIEIFTTADGLSNNTTYSILKDKNGNLWISTNMGISMFNPETKNFKIYGKAEGLMIEEFNSDAWFLAPDGEMFFGGVGGLVSFYPDSVENNLQTKTKTRLLITDFNVSGNPHFFEKPIYELGKVNLQKGDNNFQLTFAEIDFKNSENIKYRYKLSGSKNDAWIETDHHHRNISYANLTPGNYKLQIEASNIYGEWDNSINLLIAIPPYFYQTLWFKILAFLFFCFVGATFVYMYNRQIRLNERQKQDVLKLESLRGQMNPHFIFNSLNSINYFISNNDKISANNYIADFSRLIRSFLTNLSNDYIPFDKELETLEDYLKLEHLRFGNKFDYILIADEIKNKEETFVFPGMVQPFIENAVWHGVRGLINRKGFVRIEFIPESDEKILCIIEDDGIGRKLAEISKNRLPGKKSRGIGIVTERLRIISRIKNIDYKIKINDLYPDKEYSGTVVKIDLPLK